VGIFVHEILVYNSEQSEYGTLSANYFSGNIKIKGFYQQPISPDPESMVVINIPWDIIQTTYIELPPVKNYSEMKKIAELEIRRLMDLNEEINLSCIPTVYGKTLVLFVRKSDYDRYKMSRNISFEPDVAYPNILSELLVTKKFPGYWMYLVLGRMSSGIVVMNNNSIINVRILDFSMEDISKIVKEETGFELFEIERSENEELTKAAKRIVDSISIDVLSQIERELIIATNTTEIEKIDIQMISGIVVVCDFKIMRDIILGFEGNFRGKFSEPVLLFPTKDKNKIGLADLGLIYRGGIEIGKVKSIKW